MTKCTNLGRNVLSLADSLSPKERTVEIISTTERSFGFEESAKSIE